MEMGTEERYPRNFDTQSLCFQKILWESTEHEEYCRTDTCEGSMHFHISLILHKNDTLGREHAPDLPLWKLRNNTESQPDVMS